MEARDDYEHEERLAIQGEAVDAARLSRAARRRRAMEEILDALEQIRRVDWAEERVIDALVRAADELGDA